SAAWTAVNSAEISTAQNQSQPETACSCTFYFCKGRNCVGSSHHRRGSTSCPHQRRRFVARKRFLNQRNVLQRKPKPEENVEAVTGTGERRTLGHFFWDERHEFRKACQCFRA